MSSCSFLRGIINEELSSLGMQVMSEAGHVCLACPRRTQLAQ